MKKLWQGKLFFLLSLLLLTGCKDKSGLLIKTWKLDDLHFTRKLSPQMQATINNSIKEMQENMRLTYYSDGTYKTQLKSNELHGNWKLNWNSSKLTNTDDNGQTVTYAVDELSDNKFVFEAMDEKEKAIYVMVPAN